MSSLSSSRRPPAAGRVAPPAEAPRPRRLPRLIVAVMWADAPAAPAAPAALVKD